MRSLAPRAALLLLVLGATAAVVACANDGPGRTYVSDDELAELLESHNEVAEKQDRIYCYRMPPTGSHIPTRRCATLRQIRAEHEKVNRGMPSHTTGAGGGP